MDQFSQDHGKTPTRFSPATGNIGARMAERALKPSGKSQPTTGRSRGRGRSDGSSAPSFGHPDFGFQGEGQPVDNRHLELVGLHHNVKGLGRDVPFGVWATLSGNYRQLAQPGRPPFDVLED